MTKNILDDLNEDQRAAVVYCDGPQLVIAGAGSGKTRVLTYKIAYLMVNVVRPWNILALTFTNKAANEMRERIETLVGHASAKYLYMGTFHSIFCRILRSEAEKIGFSHNFTIYDESDSRSLIGTIIKQMALDEECYKAATIRGIISRAKNNLITAAQYQRDRDLYNADRWHRRPETGKIYAEYERRCRLANAMDFDDLLLNTFKLFAEHDDIRITYAQRFRYILVDEYQDTNYAQQRILAQLSDVCKRICVVGDDAQSIYAFRGANLDNMLSFPKDKQFSIFKLERNYRSTQNIVSAANSLILHNKHQIRKDVYSKKETGSKIELIETYSDKEEAAVVCKRIDAMMRRKASVSYSDFGVLYRTTAQSRCFEEQMRIEGVPYKIYGGMSFYQTKEIKDIVAYLRVSVNPHDEESLRRIINYPTRGIGNTTIAKIAEAAMQRGVTMWDVICNTSQYDIGLGTAAQKKVAAFHSMMSDFIEKSTRTDAYEFGKEVLSRSGLEAAVTGDKSIENIARRENVEEFVSALRAFVDTGREEGSENVTIERFLEEVALMTDRHEGTDDDGDCVSLMTVHAAKGLEFGTVFIVGMEENLFPNILALDDPKQLEEERRLMYVAITRAMEHCIITYADTRYRYGRLEFNTPSRFIAEIDSELISRKGEKSKDWRTLGTWEESHPRRNAPTPGEKPAAIAPASWFTSLPPTERNKPYHAPKAPVSHADDCPVRIGDTMEHQRFGIGKVIDVSGSGEDAKATVAFRNTGTKQLLLRYAKYTIITDSDKDV